MAANNAAAEDAVTVHPWPHCRPALAGAGDPLAIRIATQDTTLREAAREQMRQALSEAIGLLFDAPAASVALTAVPGEPIHCSVRGHAVHLSVSHDAGMSVAAISLRGKVGVDIMRLPTAFDWEAVARDYLGPETASHLMRLAPARQLAAFARAWTGLEARLKCAGIGLVEWSAARDDMLRHYPTRALALPPGWMGSMATADAEMA